MEILGFKKKIRLLLSKCYEDESFLSTVAWLPVIVIRNPLFSNNRTLGNHLK